MYKIISVFYTGKTAKVTPVAAKTLLKPYTAYNAHKDADQHNEYTEPNKVDKGEPEHFKCYEWGQLGWLLYAYLKMLVISYFYKAKDQPFRKGSIRNELSAGIVDII